MRSILFLLLVHLFSGCGPDDENCREELTFTNESSDTIWYGLARGDQDFFPCMIVTGDLNPNTSFTQIIDRPSCWEGAIEGGFRGSLAVYYFLEQPNNTGDDCDEEELNNLVIERREFTVEQLRELNWEIVYP